MENKEEQKSEERYRGYGGEEGSQESAMYWSPLSFSFAL